MGCGLNYVCIPAFMPPLIKGLKILKMTARVVYSRFFSVFSCFLGSSFNICRRCFRFFSVFRC
jgi:hypothetical protein